MNTGPVAVADDLTGACDLGVGCLKRGRPVLCMFTGTEGRLPGFGNAMVVLDMETRRMSPASAARRAAMIGARLRAAGRSPVYFKIDSTLRGHPTAEAEALRRASGRRLAWIVPANPGQGRWTVGGRQFVHGRPVEHSAFAADAVHPVSSGDVVALARRAVGERRCVHLALGAAASGREAVGRLRRRWLARGARMVVADAVTEEHLRDLAAVIPREDLPCGAAALARHLLGGGPSRRVGPAPRGRNRWLAVVGSLNPVSLEQLGRLTALPRVSLRTFSRRDLAGPPSGLSEPGSRGTILALSAKAFLRPAARVAPAAATRLAASLARHAARAAAELRPSRLVLSGGLTAAAVCEALGVGAMRIVGELTPGLVVTRAESPWGPLKILTKPGGFGSADALILAACGFPSR